MPYTPAWAEKITGVPRDQIITVAREFARNAEKTNGRSMVIIGAAMNHWYHCDMNYRGVINMLVMCGCVGQSGGGWSHYVGQEKLRPQTGWLPLAFGLDWSRPPRQQNSTSFFYAHTDQWRYETLGVEEILSPTAPAGPWDGAMIDYNVRAERMGWLPSAPQLETNPLTVAAKAAAAGVEPKDYVAAALKSGELKLSCEDPDNPEELAAQPVRLALQPARLVGQGARIFPQAPARHHHGVLGKDLGETGSKKPKEVVWHDEAPEGKLDLLVTLDFRMSTTCVYSDIVLPTATWYEKNDLNTSDMHPFIHPLTAAVDPVWEASSDWEIYKAIAKTFSAGRAGSARRREGRGAHPDHARHAGRDRAGARRQGLEEGRSRADPRQDHAGGDRGRARLSQPLQALHLARPADGQARQRRQGHEPGTPSTRSTFLKELNGVVTEEGPTKGLARIETDIDAAEVILMLAPETNGEVAVKAWESLGKATGRDHAHLALPKEDEKIRFRDVVAQPRKIISSPIWSGLEIGEGLLQRRLHQRPRADPVAHADRPPAALSGSSVDARLRRRRCASTARRSI